MAERVRKVGTLFVALATIFWSMGIPVGSMTPPAPVPVAQAVTGFCGDAVCDGGEDPFSCEIDCGPPASICGDAICNGGEDPFSCEIDCGPPPPICGDAVCNGGEDPFSCEIDCGPPPPLTCNNNGIVDLQDEMCDGQDLNQMTCATLPGAPFDGGQLGCHEDCSFDVSACTLPGEGGGGTCGNGTVEFSNGEVCDGQNLDNQTCQDFGFDGGTLACTPFCGWDHSGCTGEGSVCGNGQLEAGEECDDGANANGDGCSAQCFIEGGGEQCFLIDEPAACDETPGCMWDIHEQFCIADFNPCNNHADVESCNIDSGCFWEPVQQMCVMDLMGSYPAPTDQIYSFPMPFSNPQHPLTDGDPYGSANRPSQMLNNVPRVFSSPMFPLGFGFSEPPAPVGTSIQLHSYDDLNGSWNDQTARMSFDIVPETQATQWDGVTLNPLDPFTIYRLSIQDVIKASDSQPFGGQTNACPDGSGNSCWTATFKTGDSLIPGGDFQGSEAGAVCPTYQDSEACDGDPACFWDGEASECLANFSQFGCQGGAAMSPVWPFQGATGVEPFVLSTFETCVEGLGFQEATAQFREIDGIGGNLVQAMPIEGHIVSEPGHVIVELDSPLPPLTPFRLAIDGVGDGESTVGAQVDFVTGEFGGPGGPGDIAFGNGVMNIDLMMPGQGWGPTPIGPGGARVIVACGNLGGMSEPEFPIDELPPSILSLDGGGLPQDTFFMDGVIPTTGDRLTLRGLPTPSSYAGEGENPFLNPCLVFLSPDTPDLAMVNDCPDDGGPNCGFSQDPNLVQWNSYSSNSEGTLPMPSGAFYAPIVLLDDDDQDPNNEGPNVQRVILHAEPVAFGSLTGQVCLDDDPQTGDATNCGAGDTLLSDIDVHAFPMGPMDAQGTGANTVVFQGTYVLPDLPGGLYGIEARGRTLSGREINYFGTDTVLDGPKTHDIVIGLGNTLHLDIHGQFEGCWEAESGLPVHYSFFPERMTFDAHPVFGELQGLAPQGDFEPLPPNGGPGWRGTISGFGSGIYSGIVEIPGCAPVEIGGEANEPIFFGPSPQGYGIFTTPGISLPGIVVDTQQNPVPDLNFAAVSALDTGMEAVDFGFGAHVGTKTDAQGGFVLEGLSAGYWNFQTFGGDTGGASPYSFIPNFPPDPRWGFALPEGHWDSFAVGALPPPEPPLMLTVQQNKRVNFLVTDGLNPIIDAMIDVSCSDGAFRHLGHSNNAWTYLPPDTSCTVNVFPGFGHTYQPAWEVPLSVGTDLNVPQDATIVLQGINTGLGQYAASRFQASRNSAVPGDTVHFDGHIVSQPGALAGHTVIFTFNEGVGVSSPLLDGTTCSLAGPGRVECPIPQFHVDSFFDVFFDIEIPSDFPGSSMTTSLQVNSLPVTIGDIYTTVNQLTVQAPNIVLIDEGFKVFGQAYPNTQVRLAYINAAGIETPVGSTVMDADSTWYSFSNVRVSPTGDYTLKVTATAPGRAAEATRPLTVVDGRSSTPTVNMRQVVTDDQPWPMGPLTGIPTGQIFENQPFLANVGFTGTMSAVTASFLGQQYPMTDIGQNVWELDMPPGWTGFGNINIGITGTPNQGNPLDYGPLAEMLILIDPSGYIYDTDDGNRIPGATATVYQLVDGSNNPITIVTGADDGTGGGTAGNGQIEDGEELAGSGSVVKLSDGEGIDCTGGLDPAGCHWSTWEASPSGQVNPQTTNADGKYGWNVPQGWYRVSFSKSGAYSLSYSQDVYVPPAETTLNLDLGAYDIAAPAVNSVTPSDGAAGVARSAKPVIAFSEPMLASTVNSSNVKLLTGGSPVSAAISYNSSNHTATVTPSASLAASTTYTVRVTTGVKDDTSNALAATHESTFTTAAVADTVAPTSSADVAAGTYSGSQTVSLSATDDPGSGTVGACPDCTVYYTLDGSAPTTSSSVYSGALTIDSTKTLKFFAADSSGNAETPVNSNLYTIVPLVPNVPIGVVAGALIGSVSLDWDDMANATGYKVYRSTTSGSGYVLLDSPTGSLLADYAVVNGTPYYYKVAATNASGDSGLSAEVTATPIPASGGGGGVVAPFASLIAPNGGQSLSPGTLYDITWSAGGSGYAGVKLSLSTDGGNSYPTVIAEQLAGSNYGWTVPDVGTGQAKVKVEAVSSNGSALGASDASDSVFSITGAGEPEPPVPTLYGDGTIGEALGDQAADDAGLSDNEKGAPVTDPNRAGDYSATGATGATPTIDVDLGLLSAGDLKGVCQAGDLIKLADSSAVYYCGRNGMRYVFPHEKIYHSWYDDFSGVKIVTAEQLASLTIGGNVLYRPGIRMVKITSDPKVYAVSRGGTLRWIASEAVAEALYGSAWNTMIHDISDAFFFSYEIGEPITPADVGL